jgi:hypothetical protein
MGVAAFAKYLAVLLIFPFRIVKPVCRVKMLVPENRYPFVHTLKYKNTICCGLMVKHLTRRKGSVWLGWLLRF